jgi:hypothetical protein
MVSFIVGRIAQLELCRNNTPVPMTAGLNFSFTSEVKSAAILVVKPHANLEYTQQHAALKDYCVKYWKSWYAFAESKRLGLAPGEIILVYGVVRTATWALAAFSEHDTRLGAGLTLNPGVFAQIGASLYGSWDEQSSVEHRSGPPGQSHEKFDQTIFLYNYRIKPPRIPMLAPKVIRGRAGDEELEPEDEDTDELMGTLLPALDIQDIEIEVEPSRIPV